MDPNTDPQAMAEDGELEDGEICDDETEESVPMRRGDGRRPRGGARSWPLKLNHQPQHLRPLLGLQPPDFCLMMPYNPGPIHRGLFPPNHRQQCGPLAPDRTPGMPPQLRGEPSPRSNFWERSHDALGKFRHRVMPNSGRGFPNRGGMMGNRTPVLRHGTGDGHGSPARKRESRSLTAEFAVGNLQFSLLKNIEKQLGRNRARKGAHNLSKPESNVEESFEDLLMKYQQIQLELEFIKKAETLVLEPTAPLGAQISNEAPPETRDGQGATPEVVPDPAATDVLEKDEKKMFQAFNIKPLRQKLPTPAELDKLREKWSGTDFAEPGSLEAAEPGIPEALESERNAAEESQSMASCVEIPGVGKQDASGAPLCLSESSASSEDLTISPNKPVKLEEEDLSELQLRLLALQSASKKWQQKEQQVMKKSKDRITKASQERILRSSSGSSSGASPLNRKKIPTRTSHSAATVDGCRSSRSKAADQAKTGSRTFDRDQPKQTPKSGCRVLPDRAQTPGKLHSTRKLISPGSAAKQAVRKQQLSTWKLQQQRKQEEKRRQEVERRKREEEIRRIRDLSNQDEQYNRFMKLVGGKRTLSRSRDQDHRKAASKPGLDASGNLYQYDNYDEVAMDTDSETSSPAPSPTRDLLPGAGCFPALHGAEAAVYGMDFSQPFLSPMLSALPPPPPPLPPPDEMEPPPKPPFADEEEEEEMLLRETCLMSMANKRVAAPENNSSGPPSPSIPRSSEAEPVTRGNLSTVSLNMVPACRSSRFSRAHHAPRAPLVLPKHKAVVVSLKESDDSDSDVDMFGSSQTVFGGLEFMIKEARRTVEATKPKVASGCEKENNPVRSSDSLPETKKAEQRLLKEDTSSREKQKVQKDHSLPIRPVGDNRAAELRLSEAEQKLSKHRELLRRDEALLRDLLQRELKKAESLKTNESKVAELKKQLQVSEKIVSVNRTLLKKLQGEVQCVEQRVSQKKTMAVRLEQELIQAQLAAGRRPKRLPDSAHTKPSKLQRLDAAPRGSERNFDELIAQKRRLQQLESEYALKIQKLKEAQARHHKVAPAELLAEPLASTSIPPVLPQNQQVPPSSPFHLPQPSLHDLSQDKLVLESEDVPEAEDQEPELSTAATKGNRRASLHQSSNCFTKPHLDTASPTPSKDSCNIKVAKVETAHSELPPEMFAGLDEEALKKLYQQQVQLGDLLQKELLWLEEDKDGPPIVQVIPPELEPGAHSIVLELKPVPFEPYHSPLLVFRSYRFSPYYRTKEKFSLSSVTYSNTIEPNKCFCRFDLTGTCNDDGCRWQHMRNCTLSGNQLFQDILSYNLPLIGCSETSSVQDISAATETYMKKLFGPNKDRMSVDQKAVLLVSKVNESRRHVPPFTTCKDKRRWRPQPTAQCAAGPEDHNDEEAQAAYLKPAGGDGTSKSSTPPVDVVTSEDRRYFTSETDDISNLEASVVDSPRDTQLWIKLAFKYLNQRETSAAECLEAALNTLSRALESNCEDPEVWSHYLTLFCKRGSRAEVQEMCDMAVEHAPDQRVWWNYLNMESSFEGKDYVCERLLHFLKAEASSGITEKLSFYLVEALLYRVQLSLFTGRMENALALLQSALKSAQDQSTAEHLLPGDRALLWLSYIHLTEFDQLPSSLYDPAESGPGRLVSRKSFMLPWRTSEDISTPPDILIPLFKDAVLQCSDESTSSSERTQACMPLHTNLIFLYKLLRRYEEGVALCESLLEFLPDSCALRDALADLHISSGNSEQAVSMWLHTLAECPHNAQVFYHCCRFLMAQDKASAIPPLFRGFILSLCEDGDSQKTPVTILRHILGFPTEELLKGPIIRKDQEEQLRQQMSYLHLLHCRWMWLHGSVEDTVEAFERALGCVLQLEELQNLWMDYLRFSCGLQARGPFPRLLPDLLHRCLSTLPSHLELPFNPAEFWSCYDFHNKVISLYMRCVPPSHHALVLETLRNAMPTNTELSFRLLQQEFMDGNMEQLKFQARVLSSNAPRCLSSWRIAIAVERELKERGQMRLLYQQALQNLPLCAALWKDRLLFEAAEGGASEHLQQLAYTCQQLGVIVCLGGVDQTDS